jgi:hypothetical protein
MTVSAVLHHALLALSILALGVAALRAASTIVPSGLERAIAAAVLAVAAAVVEALTLGLVALGASPVALSVAAGLTWLAAARAVPRPTLSLSSELIGWVRRLDLPVRVGFGALCGAGLAAAVWQLLHPSIGFDSSVYHYAEVAGWIHNGQPGSILSLSYDLPYGNYPVTDEVALTWMAGIGRSFVPLSLWSWAMYVLFGLGSFATLRNVGAPRAVVSLGTALLLAQPLVIRQLNEPQTDVPALAWLASCAALCTAAGREPRLLAPALVAAGLALGTKTTVAVPVVAALCLGAYLARGRLRPARDLLAAALAGAVAVGGIWYLRNLFEHGSPAWPFVAAPWGTREPAFLRFVDASLLGRPVATVREEWRGYGEQLAGGLVILAAALLVLVRGALGRGLARADRRALVAAGGLTAVGLVLFAAGPGTGLQRDSLWFGPLATLRYALPVVFMATVAVAVAARAPGRVRNAALVVLGGALAWNVVEVVRLGAPFLPSAWVILAGAAGGAVAAAASGRLWRALSEPRAGPAWRGIAVAVAAAALAGIVAAPFADGYVKRHTRVEKSTALGRDVVAWLVRQPGFERDDRTVAFVARAVSAPLAGDHFEHPLRLLPANADCARVDSQSRGSTVVVADPVFLFRFIGIEPYTTGRCLAGRRIGYRRGAFTVYRPQAAANASAGAGGT